MKQVIKWTLAISMILACPINYALKWVAFAAINISKGFHWCGLMVLQLINEQEDVEGSISRFNEWIESLKFKSSRKETEA